MMSVLVEAQAGTTTGLQCLVPALWRSLYGLQQVLHTTPAMRRTWAVVMQKRTERRRADGDGVDDGHEDEADDGLPAEDLTCGPA